MPQQRPPETEGDYRLVHGPWPRWAMHLSLVKLALFAGAVVAVCLVASAAVLLLLRVFR